jgi:hypothetical protein
VHQDEALQQPIAFADIGATVAQLIGRKVELAALAISLALARTMLVARYSSASHRDSSIFAPL